jgi:electron transport complex protein RnfG
MKDILRMLAVLTFIGIVSGGVLSELSSWAEPKIEANRRAALKKAIFLVHENGKEYKQVEGLDYQLYEVYNENNEKVGYAFPHSGNGYQGEIKVMIGVKENLKEIVGIEILEQVETPGLGTKINEDPFKSQFEGLKATPQVDYVKGKEPSKPNQVQTITGATISSKAVVSIVNKGLEKIRSNKGEL